MRAIEAGGGGFGQAIVGESHYQLVLQRLKRDAFIAVGDTPIATFFIAREPDNPHDHDAIAVLTDALAISREKTRSGCNQPFSSMKSATKCCPALGSSWVTTSLASG